MGEAGLYGNFASEYGYEIETSSQRQRVRWGLFSFQKSGRLEKTVESARSSSGRKVTFDTKIISIIFLTAAAAVM